MHGGATPTRTRKEQGRGRQLFSASLEARTKWTTGWRWQQGRVKSDSRKNLVAMERRERLSEVMGKSPGRYLKHRDIGSLSQRQGHGLDDLQTPHAAQQGTPDSAGNRELTCP